MTIRQLLLAEKEKKHYDGLVNHNKKKGNKFSKTADDTLTDEAERFVKYVPFENEKVPVSDFEMREYIKEKFRKKKELDFMVEYAHNSSYDNLIDELQQSKEYNDALYKMKKDIVLKRKRNGKLVTRKGIPLNEKYHFIIIKAHKTKSGTRISSYRRYYSSTTGKQVQTGKLNRYAEVRQTQPTEIKKIHRIELIRRESLSRQIKIKERAKLQLLLEKKRERMRINKLKGRNK